MSIDDPFPQHGNRSGSHLGVDHLATFEEDEGRNRQHLEPLAQPRRPVGIDLDQLQPPRKFTSKLLQDRTHHPAGTAPGCSHVDQHWNGRGLHNVSEASIGLIHHPAQGCVALPAAWHTMRDGGNAVLGLTVRTHHNWRRIPDASAHAASIPTGGPLRDTTMSPPSQDQQDLAALGKITA
jgi:hypothetical protein